MKSVASTAMIVLLLALGGAGHAAERSYRLAGIVDAGDGRMVLVEFSDGERQWFRVGERIDDETVLEIAGDWIRVSLGEKERRVRLTPGVPIPVVAGDIVIRRGGAATPAPSNAASAPSQTGAHPGPSTTDAAQRTVAAAAAPEKSPPTPAPPPEPIRDLATLAAVLNLPPQARISAVDMVPVETGEQVLSLIQKTLDLGGGAIISVTGVPGVESVYYHPERGPLPPKAGE